MLAIGSTIRDSCEKNWPEVHAAVTGGLPQFILARQPSELGPGIPVFCYHTVDAERFEGDLQFLPRNGYVPIDADEQVEHPTRQS